MANISHKNITEANLHEPKGVSTASVGTVYVADGAGSGAWDQAPYHYSLSNVLADVSTASSTYFVIPIDGVIDSIRTVLHGAITVADANVTFTKNGVGITNSAIVVAQSGSAAGVRDSSSPSALNTVSAGDLITATSDGGSTDAAALTIVLRIKVT